MYRLKLHHLACSDELAWPIDIQNATLDTPAVEFFTDFENDPPLTIQASTRAVDAKQFMQRSQVRLLFVLSEHLGFVGIISSEDLTIGKSFSEYPKATGGRTFWCAISWWPGRTSWL